MIVAIDGPAGAGKSTVARGVAAALGFDYLDSGALYRCVALASLEQPGISPAAHAAALEVSLGERVLLAGRDVTHAIRSPTVSAQASVVAADPAVRVALVARQRDLLGSGDWVAEGRDIGTVVAPAAELKIFLEASAQERAARRAREIGADPSEVADEMRIRARPLTAAGGARRDRVGHRRARCRRGRRARRGAGSHGPLRGWSLSAGRALAAPCSAGGARALAMLVG